MSPPAWSAADDRLPLQADDRARRRAVVASTVGTVIEWYDFGLYGIAGGLVFPTLFFPKSDPLVGILASFIVFAVGYVARPLGGIVFGHYGDRIGRKRALVATVLLMGIGTFLVAFVPTYEQVGIWGAVALCLLRFVQGIGVGGEWSGSILVTMEWARGEKRGLFASWPQIGVPMGTVLANLAIGVASLLTGDAFMTWGWRVPSRSASCWSASACGSASASRRRPPSAGSCRRTGWSASRCWRRCGYRGGPSSRRCSCACPS